MKKDVQYLTDENGRKTSVVLPMAVYEELVEDLADFAAIADRRLEPTVSHEAFLQELKEDGILSD